MKRILLLAVLALAVPIEARVPLAMRLTPPVALAPAKLTVEALVETNAANRALEVVAQSADYYRSSVIQLNGENAPRLNVFEFRNLPTGTYEVISILVGVEGDRAVASRFFHVAPPIGSSR